MSTSTIRKAIGAMKDQTSISLAKVAGNVAPDLEVLVVKATTHDNEPADGKYAREILSMISSSKGYVNASVVAISKRLSKTRDWIVALKALMLVHKLLNDGGPVFGQELLLASRKGTRVLNMSDFHDEAHSGSWDHSGFVRTYALYLDQKVEFMVYERKLSNGDLSDEKREGNEVTPVRELGPEKALERLYQLLRLLDRFLASRPTGAAKSTRMVLVALCLLVKESFKIYGDVSDVLKFFLDCFSEVEYGICLKAFDAYVNAMKMIDELSTFYNWCKDVGVVRSSEFPEVHRISDKLLGSLEVLLRQKANRPKSPNESGDEERLSEIKEPSMIEIKALPSTDAPQLAQNQVVNEDLVNLKDEQWVEFPNLGSGLGSPGAENGKSGWEVVLVESASNFSNQKSDLGGGFDALLLNGMYDHGTVRQHVNSAQMRGGSASSVAFPGLSKTVPVLALPAPDGTGQPVGQHDPFAASLLVPPPAYVQIADMERKQQLVTQEQQLWQQYATAGMQGQVGLAKISGNAAGYYYDASMPYGMPQHGYYYTSY